MTLDQWTRDRIMQIMREHRDDGKHCSDAINAVYKQFHAQINASDADNDAIDDEIGHAMHVLEYDV